MGVARVFDAGGLLVLDNLVRVVKRLLYMFLRGGVVVMAIKRGEWVFFFCFSLKIKRK